MISIPAGLELVLASGSPRRRELLESVGLRFESRPADIDESVRPSESPLEYVRRLCLEKARTVLRPGEIVIGADTTVDVDGEIFEKPTDDADTRRMLRAMSGRTHVVHTGVCVIGPNASTIEITSTVASTVTSTVVCTGVTFVELTEGMIDWYIETGEATDKAGAYGIQGAAGAFVARVEGSVTNVIGLPLAETLAMLRTVLGA